MSTADDAYGMAGKALAGLSAVADVPNSLEFFDDFTRSNTPAGTLGTPTRGAAYAYTGAGVDDLRIEGNRYVVPTGKTVYAVQQLTRPCNWIGGRFSWRDGNGGAAVGAVAFLIGKSGGANLFDEVALHISISRTALYIQDLTRTPAGSGPLVFTTVKTVTFDTELSLDQIYTADFVIDGSVISYNVAGYTGKVINLNIPSIGLGTWVTHELQYSDALGSVNEFAGFDAVWAGYAPTGRTSLAERCVAHWQLSKSTWRDSTGYGATLSPLGSPTIGTIGSSEPATIFTRASGAMYLATASADKFRLAGKDWTIHLRLEPTAAALAAGSNLGIIAKAGTSSTIEWGLLMTSAGVLGAFATTNGTAVSYAFNTTVVAGTLYDVFIQYNATTKKIGLIVNNNTLVEASALAGDLYEGTSNVVVGALGYSGTSYWDGGVSRVSIFATPPGHGGILSPLERAALYNDGDGVSWPFAA